MNKGEFIKKHPSLKGKVFDKLKKGTGGMLVREKEDYIVKLKI